MLSEYKRERQHRFRSKCYEYIFLNLLPKKNMEIIPFVLFPELHESNAPLNWTWATFRDKKKKKINFFGKSLRRPQNRKHFTSRMGREWLRNEQN